MGCLLGIDIGTGSAKAVVVDPDRGGALLGLGTAAYPLHTPRPGWAEQDPADWWQAVVTAVAGALRAGAVAPGDIAAVGMAGQMQGTVLLDGRDRVLRPAPLWCDQRSGAVAERITRDLDQDRIMALTCNPLLMGSTAGKIVWVREREPDVYRSVRRLLLPKDYIRLRLTGEHATDESDASATALFDVRGRRWSDEMVEALEIPRAWLPPALPSCTIAGRVTAQAADAVGLAAGTPVIAGCGDNAAGAVGCGAVEPGIVASSVGTSAVLLAVSEAPRVDQEGRLDLFCHAVPNSWQVIGATLSAGGSLRWLRDTFGEAERAVAEHTGVDVYDLLCQEAARVSAGSDGLVFLPHLTGMRTPYPDPWARGAFVGLTLRHTKEHFVRAVLEGVAFGIRDSVEIFKELGVPVTGIRCIGGGARSALWRQIQADVLGVDHATVDVAECTAFGAALLAGVGVGYYPDIPTACRAMVHVDRACVPAEEQGTVYQESYATYRAMTAATAAGRGGRGWIDKIGVVGLL